MLKKALFISSCLIASNTYAIDITSGVSAQTLANALVGAGITISNVNYTGDLNASGTFTNGLSSGLDFDSGIILTTGDASLAIGPNEDSGATGDNGLPGSPLLDPIATGDSMDATILSFDFEVNGGNGGDVFFSYIFASEEYNEFVDGGVNDIFAFFINGENVALLPDGSPVSIDTVNLEDNSDLFIDNENGDDGTGASFDIEYDGFTVALLVAAEGLPAGTNTIELAIADVSDTVLDSAVFIQGSSFSVTPEPIPLPASLWLLFSGVGMLGWFKRSRASQ